MAVRGSKKAPLDVAGAIEKPGQSVCSDLCRRLLLVGARLEPARDRYWERARRTRQALAAEGCYRGK